MILQHIVFPKAEICKQTDLYYRSGTDHAISCQKEGIRITKGTTISFLTYFNSFSIEKWQKYTEIQNIEVSLTIQGSCIVKLFHGFLAGNDDEEEILEKQKIQESTVHAPQKETFFFPLPSDKNAGVYYVSIEAVEDTTLFDGCYQTPETQKNTVNIAIGICTYRREAFVKKTLQTLQQAFLEKADSPLAQHLHIFVSDNGNTLPLEEFNSDTIHTVYNKNAGGSGGFGRCMLEAMQKQKTYHFTHMLLMDDDIVLEPETIWRTYSLLSFLTTEYRNHFLGGSLLRLDRPYLQHACGELWHGAQITSPKEGYHLNHELDVLKNEAFCAVDYCGWWYCCFPMPENPEHFLPLPVFIHGDDIEYSLRFHQNAIFLNGIGVWHDAFDNRRNSVMAYYDLRNALICNAIHRPECTLTWTKKTVCRKLLGQMLRLRSKDQLLTLRAVEDFCQGVSFLKQQDPLQLHQELGEMGYPQEDVTELLEKYQIDQYYQPPADEDLYQQTPFTFFEKITINGWLLPGKRKCIPVALGAHPKKLFRRSNVLLFDPDTKKGFVTKRKRAHLFTTLFRCIKACSILNKSYSTAVEDFQRHSDSLTTESFWRDYLDAKH